MSETQIICSAYRLEKWAEIMRARKSSGLTTREFCRQNEISEGAYYYWRKKLRETATQGAEGLRLVKLEEMTGSTASVDSIMSIANTATDDTAMSDYATPAKDMPSITAAPLLQIRYGRCSMELPNGVDLDAVAAVLRSVLRP